MLERLYYAGKHIFLKSFLLGGEAVSIIDLKNLEAIYG